MIECRAVTAKTFSIDGNTVALTATSRDGDPVVVCAVDLRATHPELHAITVDFPMKSAANARHFVDIATEDTARRGYEKVMGVNAPFLAMMQRILATPIEQVDRAIKQADYNLNRQKR